MRATLQVVSTLRHAHDKFYQAPSFSACNVEKLREPGDEARNLLQLAKYGHLKFVARPSVHTHIICIL